MRWVPGHIGIKENDETDNLAMEEVNSGRGEEDEILSCGKWK